jgi:hypothetical protein
MKHLLKFNTFTINEKKFSEEKREELAKEKFALPDGSFPIENVADLKRAIKAHGRSKDIEAAKKHIEKS